MLQSMCYKVCNEERLHIADCKEKNDRPAIARCHIDSKEYSFARRRGTENCQVSRENKPLCFNTFYTCCQRDTVL